MQRTILGSVACLVLFFLIVGGLHLFIDPVLAEGTAAKLARNALTAASRARSRPCTTS